MVPCGQNDLKVSLHPSPADASLTGEGQVYLGAQRHSPVKGCCSGHEGDKGGMEVLCMKAQIDEELSSCESSPTFIPRRLFLGEGRTQEKASGHVALGCLLSSPQPTSCYVFGKEKSVCCS